MGKDQDCAMQKDLSKYAYFIMNKSENTSVLKSFLKDRLKDKNLVSLVERDREKALLLSLQVISDVIAHGSSTQRIPVSPNKNVIKENEELMRSISEHNLRMARLNKEISQNSEAKRESGQKKVYLIDSL